MYALSPLMIQSVKKGVGKDKQKYVSNVKFVDKVTSGQEQYVAVASQGMLCQSIVFDSIVE